MRALFCAQAITEASFSMAMMVDQRFESANAIAFPPAPANMSITTVFEEGVLATRSLAICLMIC